jgi:hypothetical protein
VNLRGTSKETLDSAGSLLLPRILQLPAPETIDVNSVQARAYRLSPPVFESPFSRILDKAEVLIIFGGVAAGGGGFAITPGGHIIPIPPPRPDVVTTERMVALVRETLRELAVYAEKTGQQAAFRAVAKALVEETSAILKR